MDEVKTQDKKALFGKNKFYEALAGNSGQKGWYKLPKWIFQVYFVSNMFGKKEGKWGDFGKDQIAILSYLWFVADIDTNINGVFCGELSINNISKILNCRWHKAKAEVQVLINLGIIEVTDTQKNGIPLWFTTPENLEKIEEEAYLFINSCYENTQKSLSKVLPNLLRGSSQSTRGVVDWEEGGSSQSTRGVVDWEEGGSSQSTRGVVDWEEQYKNNKNNKNLEENKFKNLFVEGENKQTDSIFPLSLKNPSSLGISDFNSLGILNSEILEIKNKKFLETSKTFRFLNFFNKFEANTNLWKSRALDLETVSRKSFSDLLSWQSSRINSVEDVFHRLISANKNYSLVGKVVKETTGSLWVWIYNDLYQLLFGNKKVGAVKFDSKIYDKIPALRVNDKREDGYHTTRIIFLYALVGYALMCKSKQYDFREETFFENVEGFMLFAHKELYSKTSLKQLLGYIASK